MKKARKFQMAKTITANVPISKVNGITVNTSYIQTKNCNVKSSRTAQYVVIHYTGNSSDKAVNNAKYFASAYRGVSAHYFVDETTIYQSVDFKNIAWHCGTNGKYYNACRNSNSIGIEMCCSSNYKVSAKTIENSAYLCAKVCELLNISANDVDKYVVRHYDVTHKECPKQFVKNANEWVAFKSKVKTILNKATTKAPTTNSVATTKGTLKAGTKLNLKNVPIFTSATTKTLAGYKSGVYYIWSDEVTNNRVRITNKPENVGKANQVTGFIDLNSAKQMVAEFQVKVIADNLNIRKGAGTSYAIVGTIKPNVYTIVETKGTVGKAGSWGKLKSGVGWISLNSCYAKKL